MKTMTLNSPADLSVVIPLYNESENIDPLYQRLKKTIDSMHLTYEIVFADDGSKDDSFEKVKAIAARNTCVKGISLSRNFGHQVALSAGLRQATGKAVISMDADLQHPPELLPKLYAMFLYKNNLAVPPSGSFILIYCDLLI